MAYEIEYTAAAREDLKAVRTNERREIEDSVRRYLSGEPDQRSRKRKPLDPNPLDARWALRLGNLRVYYDIDQETRTVWILRAGVKRGNRLLVRGAEVDLRALGELGGQEEEP